jgi:hypothetical protein
MRNTVVLHYAGGDIRKGTIDDFFPNKSVFHFQEAATSTILEVSLSDLKAVYFVKDFAGRADYQEKDDTELVGFGKKIMVSFKDGETQIGYTQGFSPGRAGFFLFPADPESNNDRIFVATSATVKIDFL